MHVLSLICLCYVFQRSSCHVQPSRIVYQRLGFGAVERGEDIASDFNTTVFNASFATTYSFNVNLKHQYLLVYSYNETNKVSIKYNRKMLNAGMLAELLKVNCR